MPNRHIFLSYRSIEQELARRLAQDLGQSGFSIWIDQFQGIQPGDNWIQTLQDALNRSIAILPVLSPAYVQSRYCRMELQRAVSLELPVVPVLLEPLTAQDMPFEIQSIQYVDFQNWNDPTKYTVSLNKLITEGLVSKLGIQPDTSVQPIPTPAYGRPLHGRTLEDEVAAARQSSRQPTSRLMMLKRERIEGELDQAVRQWEAVTQELLMTIEPSYKDPLTRRVEHLEIKISRLESDLKTLK